MIIEKAKIACTNSNYQIEDHFADVGKMINLAKEAIKEIEDYKLSHLFCYSNYKS